MKLKKFVTMLVFGFLLLFGIGAPLSQVYAADQTSQFGSILESLKKLLSSFQSQKNTQTAAVSDFDSALVAHYAFDGDASGGTAVGGPTYSTGVIGQAVSVDGADDHVSMGDVAGADGGSISVSVWVKPAVGESTHTETIVGKYKNTGWYLWRGSSDHTYRFTVGTASSVRVDSDDSYEDSDWHHLVGVYDGATIKIYVDGELQGSKNQTGTIPDISTPLCVGSISTTGLCVTSASSALSGLVDDVRIYSKALSDNEVEDLFEMGSETAEEIAESEPEPEQESEAENEPESEPEEPTAPAQAPDTTKPTVTISAPASGALLSGTVTLTATASDPTSSGQVTSGIEGVQFKVDGVDRGSEDSSSPYSTSWNTTTATNGNHTIVAVATDAAGNQTTATAITVSVNNAVLTPTNGVCGLAARSYTATEVFPLGSFCTSGTASPLNPGNPATGRSSTWTCSGTNGGIAATCSANRTAALTVLDTVAPTTPTNLASFNITQSSATLSWSASIDAKGVTGYRIYRNGTIIGTSAIRSYIASGLTASTAYTFTVAAVDAAGNISNQSSPISVTTKIGVLSVQAVPVAGTPQIVNPMVLLQNPGVSTNQAVTSNPITAVAGEDPALTALRTRIQELQTELQAQALREGESSVPSAQTAYNFSTDLYLNIKHPDVWYLQRYLNTHGYPVGVNVGSFGKEVTTFGPVTEATLKKFQAAHGINPTGYFGAQTRAVVNAGQ